MTTKTTYKVWVSVEAHHVHSNGADEYEELPTIDLGAIGEYDTEDEAVAVAHGATNYHPESAGQCPVCRSAIHREDVG